MESFFRQKQLIFMNWRNVHRKLDAVGIRLGEKAIWVGFAYNSKELIKRGINDHNINLGRVVIMEPNGENPKMQHKDLFLVTLRG